ncbi:MAG: amidohydrolase family protein [Ruminococcus sp.]
MKTHERSSRISDAVKKTADLPADGESFVLHGDICYSVSLDEMRTVKSGYAVCIGGRSRGVFAALPPEYAGLTVYDYSGKLIIPGLVDLHIHAPQYPFRGTGMDLELMDWLQKQAFPEEARYADLAYAQKAYCLFAAAMQKSATSHACIFATRHRPATELLMELMEQSGIVSFVGKVNMDREAPDELREPSAADSASETVRWLRSVQHRYKHTKPILTPRFVPGCTSELLRRLQELQTAYGLPVQSHLSENPGEVEFVRRLCPDSAFYGDVYDRYGLFGKEHGSGKSVRTVMAHCVYSTEAEMQRMKDNGVFVAHCPASNVNLSSGIAPVRKYLTAGLHVGLGSDVAGGHTESMLRAVCDAVQMSKLYWRLIDSHEKPLTFREAFYLATKGGGAFFGNVGSFERDYDFSAVVLDDARIPQFQELSLPERLERAAYESLDLYGICAKFVSGAKLFGQHRTKSA